jgi:rhomboid family protein
MKNRNGYEDDSDFGDSYQESETWGASPAPRTSCPVTKTLVAVIAAIWVLQILLFRFAEIDLVTWFGLEPRSVLEGCQFWRLVTWMFLHQRPPEVFHILFNVVGLWIFGRAIEHRLGTWRFLVFYGCAGIAAALLYLIFHLVGAQYTSAIGASGAIMGILVLFACFYPDAEVLAFLLIPLKAKYLVLIFVALDVLFSVVVSAHDEGYAHSAHLGGAAFGYVYYRYSHRFGAWLHGWERQREKRERDREREEKEVLDDILSKISREGMGSLTGRERRFLQNASRRVRGRQD